MIYDNLVYDNRNLKKVTSYKYLGIDFHCKLNWNYSWKTLWCGTKGKSSLNTRGCSISKESRRRIEQIQKLFITYNLKIKSKTPYPILLSEPDSPHWKHGYDYNNETTTSQNIHNIKIIITSTFKEKMPCKEVKRKLQYYKEIINPNFDNKNYQVP